MKLARRVGSFVFTSETRPSPSVLVVGETVWPPGPVTGVTGVTGAPVAPSVIGGTRFVVELSGIGKPVIWLSVKPVNDARIV